MAGTNVQYNGTSIQTANVIVNNIDHDSIPTKNSTKFALARAHRSIITGSWYQEKIITILGQITGTSIVDAENRADAFKTAMNPYGNTANIDIDYAGSTRRYIATTATCALTRSNALFAVGFSLTFTCLMPWGQDTAATTLVNAVAVTTSPFTQAITVGGNGPEQSLLMSYTLTSFTGSATNTVYFTNSITTQQISLARTWTAGDVVLIDPANLSAKVNGVEVDYDGVFPLVIPGSGNLIVTDGFTARAGVLTVTQVRRWW